MAKKSHDDPDDTLPRSAVPDVPHGTLAEPTREVEPPAGPRDVEPRVADTPGWSNTTDTTPTPRPVSPGVDMSQAGFSNNGPAATGATAGAPGNWTPAKSDPPNTFALMNTIAASPGTAWTTGQYVTLGDGSLAHWGGAAWTSGKA